MSVRHVVPTETINFLQITLTHATLAYADTFPDKYTPTTWLSQVTQLRCVRPKDFEALE